MVLSSDTLGIDAILLGVFLACVGTAVFVYFKRRKEDTERKRNTLHIFTPKEQNVILVMASAAKTDKEIASSEVEKIRAVIQTVTGRNVTIADVLKVLKLASSSFNKRDIRGLASGISDQEKRDLLKALFGVIAADGKLRKEERAFSKRFCQDLDINQSLFDKTWIEYFESNPQRLVTE